MKIVKFRDFIICNPLSIIGPSGYTTVVDCARDLNLINCHHCCMEKFCFKVRTKCFYPDNTVIF